MQVAEFQLQPTLWATRMSCSTAVGSCSGSHPPVPQGLQLTARNPGSCLRLQLWARDAAGATPLHLAVERPHHGHPGGCCGAPRRP